MASGATSIEPRYVVNGKSPNSGLPLDENRLFRDDRYYIESLMSIRTESRGIQPFIFNPVQAELHQKHTRREIILKARRHGISSEKLGVNLVDVMMSEGHVACIMAHNPKATARLFTELKIMYQSIDPRYKPRVGYDNRNELTFPEMASSVYIECAGATRETSQNVARGGKINRMHFSEYAFYKTPAETMTASIASVPDDEGYASIESTPNGFNDFHAKVMEAIAGKGTWRLFFFPWYYDPKNWVKLGEGEAEELFEELTDEERELILRYSLKLEQIAWRRQKMGDYPTRERFLQEYPEDPQSCFLSSGMPYFNLLALDAQRQKYQKAPMVRWSDGTLVPVGWRVFKEPQRGHQYLIGADTSEGLASGHWDSGIVIDRENLEVVTHLYHKWAPHLYAHELAEAGWKYNEAYIGVENNNHGGSVLQALLHTEQYPQRSVYFMTEIDRTTHRAQMKPGWSTNIATRPIMLDELSQHFDLEAVIVPDEVILNACMSFEDDPLGRPEGASGGAPDDPVIGLAIAVQMRKFRRFELQATNFESA